MLLILFFIILLVLVLPFSETDVLDETGRTDSHDDVSTAPKSIRKKVAGNTSFNSVSRRRLAEGVTFASKLENLKHKAAKTVLVHMHIPKAGGTAIALALSSSCECRERECEHQCSPIACNKCPEVKGRGDFKFPYTISRVTGWRCGVHSPLAVMRKAPCHGNWKFADKGVFPVFVIIIREPFNRFVSESVHWSGGNGQGAVDWCAPVKTNGKKDMKGYVQEIAELPSTMLIHNRQIRMIGGIEANFQMSFKPREGVLGSRWVPSQTQGGINGIFDRAKDAISAKTPDVIIGLHEKFAEFVCVLEVLYGDLYKFKWDPNENTHRYSKASYKSFEDEYAEYRESGVYKTWLENNRQDSAFYGYAVEVFDRQFGAAISMLRGYGEKYLKYAPHCKPFFFNVSSS